MAAPNDTDHEHVSPRNNQADQQQIEEQGENSYHNQFVDALESYGASGRWDKMAAELGQPIDEVKLYAYRYMAKLQNAGLAHRSNRSGPNMHVVDGGSIPMSRNNFQNDIVGLMDYSKQQNEQERSPQAEWNVNELSLLGTLVAVYSSTDSLTEDEKWKKIAAMLPGKNVQQCREQFLREHSDRADK